MKITGTVCALAVVVTSCAVPTGGPGSGGNGSDGVASNVDTTTSAGVSTSSATSTIVPIPPTTTTAAPGSTVPPDTEELITFTSTISPADPPGTVDEEFTPIGTAVIPLDLPEGAIGPSEIVMGNGRQRLSEFIGVSTYRLRSEVTVGMGDFGSAELIVEVDVDEGSDREDMAWRERWYTSAEGSEPVLGSELIGIDGTRYDHDLEDDVWTEVGFPWEVGGPFFAVPTDYSMMHAYAYSGYEWIGNDEIDGVSVGHFRMRIPEELSEPTDDVPTSTFDVEYWMDERGVVWRLSVDWTIEGQLFQHSETELHDLDADIAITSPLP